MSEGSRRFTDREVALVLRKAAEIDEERGAGSGGALSLTDLQEIAAEVGISPESISQAVDRLERGDRPEGGGWLAGAAAVHKAAHAIQGELNGAALTRLLQVVDERMASAGAVSEALGSVRWTSSDRFSSTQVALTPGGGETTIQVVEKLRPRWKRLAHLIPGAWGAMIGGLMVNAINPPTMSAWTIFLIGTVLGLVFGRGVWTYLADRSEKRVQRLAADLSREAYSAAKAGMLESG